MFLITLYSKQLAAKRRIVDFTASGMSFTQHRNKRRPSMVPRGTPDSTGAALERSPSTTIVICL